MRAKKTKKRSGSIQYRLLADRKLQRLSLRKVTERVKKAPKPLRAIRSKSTAAAKAPTRFAWPTSSRAIVLAMTCVVVAAALVTARQDPPRQNPPRAEFALAGAPPAAVAAQRETPRQRDAKKPVMPTASAAAPLKAAVESPPQAEPDNAGAVTMTGCLELDEETYRLADVSGVDAPKSRSWKSGFLRKRPAKVELVDTTSTLRLSSHVGRRVAATGTLIDGEMRAHSLRAATGGPCLP